MDRLVGCFGGLRRLICRNIVRRRYSDRLRVNSNGSPPLDAQIRAREGAECIYAEKQWIAHARVGIDVLTDTQLGLRVSAFSTPGFTPPEPTWEAGVALSEFRFFPDCWMGSPYLAWIIAFDPKVINCLIATAHIVQHQPAQERAFALRDRLATLIWPELADGGD